MTRRSKKISAAAAAFLALAVANSRPAILQLEDTFSGIPDFSTALVFQQFNPAWGVLNAVTITLNLYAVGGSLRVDNDSQAGETSDVSFGSQAVLDSDDVILLTEAFGDVIDTVVAATTETLNTQVDDGDAEVGGTSFFSSQGNDYGEVNGGTVYATDSGQIGSLFLNGFQGTGTFVIDVDASQYLQLGSLSGAQRQIDPLSSSGSVIVAYDYTGAGPPAESSAVPEPSVITLLLGSLTFLFVTRRHARKRMRS